ncbi:MAG TPA: GNAT family protein [Ktedonobacteraceae bacterium]|nr:GNAT family protein [Ktedonobacteraceae bacterium]
MQFFFHPMNEEEARAVLAWRYEGPYAVYNMQAEAEEEYEEALKELLDRRSPHYAARNEAGELVGFFGFGSSAYVTGFDEPHLYSENNTITVGLGMRPDLTGQGKGLGLAFVNAGLDFARQEFAPDHFRLFVLTFNERAIRVYEKAGFQRARVVVQRNPRGERLFLEMSRRA